MLKLLRPASICAITVFISQTNFAENYVQKLSVSSNGNYVITSNLNRNGVLWDLNKKTHTKIPDPVNIYSPQFNKTDNEFTWQNDKSNDFYIQKPGKTPTKWFSPGFPVYSYLLVDNKLIATDKQWSVYEINQNNTKTAIKKGLNNDGIFTYGFPLSIINAKDKHNFISIGFASDWDKLPISKGIDAYSAGKIKFKRANFSLLNGAVLWNLQARSPIKKLAGNNGKLTGALSPDHNTLLVGDEAGFLNICKIGRAHV